ncbi:hypothetical protein Tco_1286012 [Tanacetum coccineum]
MATLRKLDANVPNDADYDIWSRKASVHEFLSTEGIDSMLRDDPWMIREFHDVSLVAYTSNGLSLIGSKIETIHVEYEWEHPRCSMCLLFGHSLDYYPKVPKRVVNRVEKGKSGSSGFIVVKKKKSGGNGGTKNFKPVSVKPETQYIPKVNRTNTKVFPKTASTVGKKNGSPSALNVYDLVTVEVESGNKAFTSGVQVEGNSSTSLVEKIYRFETQLLEEKCVLLNEDGKPLKKVDYSGDHGSEDEVDHVDNEMASFLAKTSGVGYGTKSMLEQWRKTYGDVEQEYDYDPYDDDMYEGQVPDNIQTICNNMDIKIRGRLKK